MFTGINERYRHVDGLSRQLQVFVPNLEQLLEDANGHGVHSGNVYPFRDSTDAAIGRLYYLLYTLPILEEADLLEPQKHQDACFWGKVQFSFALHTRFIDYVIDQDAHERSRFELFKRSQNLLCQAQWLLQQRSMNWSSHAQATYNQFLDYEIEASRGYTHDFGSLWRRVSPLCIVPECYLSPLLRDHRFYKHYRHFLEWSLIQADCDDLLHDLDAGNNTPVTRIVREQQNSTYLYPVSFAVTIGRIKMVLASHIRRLLTEIGNQRPVWTAIIHYLDDAFQHSS